MADAGTADETLISKPWRGLFFLLLAAMLLGVILGTYRLIAGPKVVLLLPQGAAQWIRVDHPFDAAPHFTAPTAVVFQTTLQIPRQFPGAELEVTALRRGIVWLDSTRLFDTGADLNQWKTVYKVPLPAGLRDGPHLLVCAVSNQGGPSMLRIRCDALNVHTDDTWLASSDALQWGRAIPANRTWNVLLPPQFQSSIRDLIHQSPFLICLFAVSSFLLSRRSTGADWGLRLRWILLLAWSVLAINNIMKVPLEFGYDADQHTRYIQYVAEHLSLPRPDAGWQFFQSPLYYVLSAILQRALLVLGVAAATVPFVLRLIPLACGAMVIEISFRAARIVFPTRPDLQAIATVVGGLLPVNIYMAQAVSNEPLAAVMSGLIVLIALRFLNRPELIESPKALMLMGVIMGVAFLTKVNTVILFPPAGLVMVFCLLKVRAGFMQWWRAIGSVSGAAMCVCGWLLIRNLILIGRPFFLESSIARFTWWQDPGYRTPEMFYEFGQVFSRPIYNGTSSVWDCVYGTMWGNGIVIGHPAWNFSLMSCGLFLAIIPMLAIFAGVFETLRKREKSLVFALSCIACFLVAILYVYLTLPIYSCAKASYMLGSAPCIGLLAAAGFNLIRGKKWLRALVGGGMVCWAVTSYLTFFVL